MFAKSVLHLVTGEPTASFTYTPHTLTLNAFDYCLSNCRVSASCSTPVHLA